MLTKGTLAGKGCISKAQSWFVARSPVTHTWCQTNLAQACERGMLSKERGGLHLGRVPSECQRHRILDGESVHFVECVSNLQLALPSIGHVGRKHHSLGKTVILPLIKIIRIFISHYSSRKYCKIAFTFTPTSNYSCATARHFYVTF